MVIFFHFLPDDINMNSIYFVFKKTNPENAKHIVTAANIQLYKTKTK